MKNEFLHLSLLLVLVSCSTPQRLSAKLKTAFYKTDAVIIHPEYSIFHTSSILSELHFKISSKELLYTRSDGINLSSNVVVSYRLLYSYEAETVLDSASSRLIDINNDNADKYLIGKINFNAKMFYDYFLYVTIADLNRNNSVTKIIKIEKTNALNRQNFIARSADSDIPLFRNYVKSDEKIIINYKIKNLEKIYVRYYNRDFPIAAPPFSEVMQESFHYEEDSIFILDVSPEGKINFSAGKKGFYHFQSDLSSREGFTLFNFSTTFPDVKKAEAMIPPIRYITSSIEFEELNKDSNKKIAIENFWLKSTSNQERARNIIKKYYNRVKESNLNFSSYIEGWKTDRGMIFLIYGSPTLTYKSENSETWIYGDENNVNSFSFSFLKVNNPFTDNDFTLTRSPFYRQSWYLAVDAWRQGRSISQE